MSITSVRPPTGRPEEGPSPAAHDPAGVHLPHHPHPEAPARASDLLDDAPGIINRDPYTVQCAQCGATDDPDTLGVPISGRRNPNLVLVLTTIRFHAKGWDDGTNPRLCQQCRLARGCTCWSCAAARRTP